jgi:hypothetical protein
MEAAESRGGGRRDGRAAAVAVILEGQMRWSSWAAAVVGRARTKRQQWCLVRVRAFGGG